MYDTKGLIASAILMFSITFLGGWLYETALTREPAYMQHVNGN